ncbi:MAG TPA: IS630 family transposase [Candidatus Sulfotelmatobacter sp.]|nr:IS630 family transposase [Candidatus Sulfotelmatobacter sp.]
MPRETILHITQEEQAQMLGQLRQARYGYLLGLHILLLCCAGHSPTEIATFLFCSRSSVYRAIAAYRCGQLPGGWSDEEATPKTRPLAAWQRCLLSLVKKAPAAFGWCRTRWSCATLALQLCAQRGYRVSRETVRRALHHLDYSWKRARPCARDDDPQRVSKLARIRHLVETLTAGAALFFVDELDIHLLAKIGYEWMPKGTQKEVWTPGKNQKHYLAGALDYRTGKLLPVTGPSKNRWLFIDLLKALDRAYPASRYRQIYLVADNYKIHTAKAVEQWLKDHPRFEIVWLPSYCPKANPIERVFGDVHDKCTRNHKRKRLRDLIGDVLRHVRVNGPWPYHLSEIYYTPAVTRAVSELESETLLAAA